MVRYHRAPSGCSPEDYFSLDCRSNSDTACGLFVQRRCVWNFISMVFNSIYSKKGTGTGFVWHYCLLCNQVLCTSLLSFNDGFFAIVFLC